MFKKKNNTYYYVSRTSEHYFDPNWIKKNKNKRFINIFDCKYDLLHHFFTRKNKKNEEEPNQTNKLIRLSFRFKREDL